MRKKIGDVQDESGNIIGTIFQVIPAPIGPILLIVIPIVACFGLSELFIRLPPPLMFGIPIAYLAFWGVRAYQGKKTPSKKYVVPLIALFGALIFGIALFAPGGGASIPILLLYKVGGLLGYVALIYLLYLAFRK